MLMGNMAFQMCLHGWLGPLAASGGSNERCGPPGTRRGKLGKEDRPPSGLGGAWE